MVIINADDFGMNERCSRAIAEAFEKGLITHTTMVANGDFFDEGLKLAREKGFFNRIGLHFNITEGKPLTDDIKAFRDFVSEGRFNKGFSADKTLTDAELEAVYKELSAQADRLSEAGVNITHADSHHYIHTFPDFTPIAERVCGEKGIKRLRISYNLGAVTPDEIKKAEELKKRLRASGFVTTDYFGRLRDFMNGKVPDNTELIVHPDYDRDGKVVDRRGVADGFAFGDALHRLTVVD